MNAEFNLFSYSTFIHALSGGLGGAFAISVFYPFENARTRLQVDDNRKSHFSVQVIAAIYRNEGSAGVYRGWFSLVVAFFVTNCVYFYVFHGSRAYFQDFSIGWQGALDLVLGLFAGTIAVLASNPLWVVNTRLKLQGAKLHTQQYKELKHPHYSGITDCLWKIVQYEGAFALWSGLATSLLLVCNPSIQFMAYEMLKKICSTVWCSQVLDAHLYFILGAIAKAIATVLTYPLQVYQTCTRAGISSQATSSERKTLRASN